MNLKIRKLQQDALAVFARHTKSFALSGGTAIEKILKNPFHPRYVSRMITILSQSDKPKEVFSIIDKEQFIETWPKIRRYWQKIGTSPDFLSWWDTVYGNMLEKQGKKYKPKERLPQEFAKIGNVIRKARIEKSLSQIQLAQKVGLTQPHISDLEKGEKNVTLSTLIKICDILGIKEIPV